MMPNKRWSSKGCLLAPLAALAWVFLAAAQTPNPFKDVLLNEEVVFSAHPSNEEFSATAESKSALPLRKLLQDPLRDVSVTSGPDKWYYLTGTYEFDAESVRVWRSRDLLAWEPIGVAYRHKRPIVAPELQFAKGNFWVSFGEKGGGTFLYKSRSKRAMGPYVLAGQITREGRHPSLFVEGEAMYWVWDEGKLAKLRPDGSAIVGEPKILRPSALTEAIRKDRNAERQPIVGTHGAQIRKINNRYFLLAAESFDRGGTANEDLFVAEAASLDGPWSRRYLLAPNAGATTIFDDGQGHYWVPYCGGEGLALWGEGVGLLEVKHSRFWRAEPSVILETGPLALQQPRYNTFLRDPQLTAAGDGWYYMTGTRKQGLQGEGIEVWRSQNLQQWESLGLVWTFDRDAKWSREVRQDKRAVWAPEIHYLKKDFWITYSMNYGGTGLLRSTTGMVQGPYEEVKQRPMTERGIDSTLFQDEDGSIYFIWQGGQIAKLNAEMTGFEGATQQLLDTNGKKVGYEGVSLAKIAGKYVLTAAEWNGDMRVDGTYDMMVATADTLFGPYTARKVLLPHAGHGMLFADKLGNWWATFFGNDRTAPFRQQLGLVPLQATRVKDKLQLKPLLAHPARTP